MLRRSLVRILVFISLSALFSIAETPASHWRKHPAAFEAPHWRAVKGEMNWWKLEKSKISCRLPKDQVAWLLSGTQTSGSWTIEATFEPPFLYRDEGLLINVTHDLSRGLLVSIGPFAKVTLSRIKNGEIDSVAMEFLIAPALGARTLRVTRVGASYDF